MGETSSSGGSHLASNTYANMTSVLWTIVRAPIQLYNMITTGVGVYPEHGNMEIPASLQEGGDIYERTHILPRQNLEVVPNIKREN